MKTLLVVSDLTVVAFGRTIFDRFSLSVSEGEVVALLGPNGSGKSTLLDVVAGVRPALRGTVTVAGVDARDRSAAARELGYAADRPELPGELRVDEWLALVGAVRGARTMRADDRAFDVGALRGQPLGKLSLGETRRVLLASALIGRSAAPRVLLFDEPTNGLDLARRAELDRVIASHAKSGGAVVVATHDRAFASATGARRVDLADFAGATRESVETPSETPPNPRR
ncbi:ABC transporter ATP-binding protein [soil metagenome]